jgi:hypothetical protein
METMPTDKQMLQCAHHKTLTSLQDKLKTHSTTLQDILKKVLIDAQEVVKRREAWKNNKKQYRELNKNVSKDVSKDVTHKRREREDIDKEKNIYKGIFQIPSVQEITLYCQQRNNTINPQTFIDHYTGNGWMVGKNKMKDWKAVIRTWESRGGNYGAGTNRVSDGRIGIPKEYIPESRLLPSDEEIKRGFEEIQKIKNSIGQNPIKGGS